MLAQVQRDITLEQVGLNLKGSMQGPLDVSSVKSISAELRDLTTRCAFNRTPYPNISSHFN